MLVVLDTNILVSALLFRGRAASLHRVWVEGGFRLAVTAAIMDEYRRVLLYEKFGLIESEVEYLLSEEVLPFSLMTECSGSGGPWIDEDPDDDRFIRATLESKADYLVVGDCHILDRRAELPCRVLSLTELAGLIGA